MLKNLKELQKSFQNYLLKDHSKIIDEIKAENLETKQRRLQIYQYAYEARLRDVLQQDFPATRFIMGEEIFNETCNQYIQQYPSSYFSLDQYGNHFPAFLYNESLVLAGEMAAWEWSLSAVLFEKNIDTLTIEDLQAIPQEAWEEQHFSLIPACRYLKLQWNIEEGWQAYLNQKPFLPQEIAEESSHWLIYCNDLQVFYIACTPIQACIIQALYKKKSFIEVCELLCEWLPEEEVINYFVSQLVDWINKKLIAKIPKPY